MSLSEFDIITTYFQKGNKRKDVVLGIGDDCAILRPPSQKNLLISTDTLNIGVHFFEDTSPIDIGFKSVAVSLSDLAAMGGEPAWLLLSLTLPKADPIWLEGFSQGLFSCMQPFNMQLVGGNLTKGPLAVTTQIIGFGQANQIMTRSGAKPKDLIYVTGTLGGGALALAILKNQVDRTVFTPAEIKGLMQHLWRPEPRIQEGQKISPIAHAAIDISDGLLADLDHILTSSQVGATLELDKIPVSSSLEKMKPAQKYDFVLNGGDDYELCFTISRENIPTLKKIMQSIPTHFTCIGEIEAKQGLRVKENGKAKHITKSGYQHF